VQLKASAFWVPQDVPASVIAWSDCCNCWLSEQSKAIMSNRRIEVMSFSRG
jgi:hypothetical protein